MASFSKPFLKGYKFCLNDSYMQVKKKHKK